MDRPDEVGVVWTAGRPWWRHSSESVAGGGGARGGVLTPTASAFNRSLHFTAWLKLIPVLRSARESNSETRYYAYVRGNKEREQVRGEGLTPRGIAYKLWTRVTGNKYIHTGSGQQKINIFVRHSANKSATPDRYCFHFYKAFKTTRKLLLRPLGT